MKKLSLIFGIIFSCSSCLFSQVKNYIPIVKPVLYEKTKETFENVAQKFEQKNYNELAQIFRSFAKGGHGSGFIYVDDDGENYVITNKHVIANSEFVNLEFSGKGSTKLLYENCPIIYTDDNIDLAVIKFPNNEKVFDKSFKINSEKQPDGKEIWSAGFPGLMGQPMWQFSKGNVTNEEAYVDQLIAPDISYLIQHSASIDPGNSGGPLLVKDDKGQGYSVIGVNTWTITNRQNTFFAIPSQAIPALVQKAKHLVALKEKKDSLKTSLINHIKIFSSEINSEKPDWKKAVNFISYDFVGNKGWESFIKVLDEGDKETLKLLETKFFSYSPIEAMRYSILYRIWRKLYYFNDKKLEMEFKGINPSDELALINGKSVRTNFIINGSPQEVEWFFEHGHWRINYYDLDKAPNKKEKESDVEVYEEKKHQKSSEQSTCIVVDVLGNPYTRCFKPILRDNFNLLGYGGGLSINFGGRLSIFARLNTLSLNNEMKNKPESLSSASVKFLHVSNGIMVYIGNGKLRPYTVCGFNYLKFTETGANTNISVTKRYERLGFLLGLGLKYKISKKFGIFSDITYNSDSLLPEALEDYSYANLSNLQTAVGISFNLKK